MGNGHLTMVLVLVPWCVACGLGGKNKNPGRDPHGNGHGRHAWGYARLKQIKRAMQGQD